MLLTDKGGEFEMPEPGSYGSICHQLIDIGTQETEWLGKKGSKRQIILGWEMDEPMEDGRPFVVSRFYTASLSENATLRAHLAAWRGRDFTPEELGGFDPKNLLGKPCLLSLVKNDKGKVKVDSVARMPKGMVPHKLVNPTVYLSLEPGSYDQNVFDSLSKGIQDIIRRSPEWQARDAEAHSVRKPEYPQVGSLDDFEDDIPFS